MSLQAPELILSEQVVNQLPAETLLLDAEVQERFDAVAAEIDEMYTDADERAISAIPDRKTSGNAEAFSMWKP